MDEPSNDPWTVGEMTVDGQPFIVRMREAVPRDVVRADYPYLISILWTYEGATSGLPGEDVHELMGQMEERLDSLERDHTAYMMVTTTGNDEKEWFWYSCDVQAFMDHLNAALHGLPVLPLTIEGSEDPEWNAFGRFVSAQASRTS